MTKGQLILLDDEVSKMPKKTKVLAMGNASTFDDH